MHLSRALAAAASLFFGLHAAGCSSADETSDEGGAGASEVSTKETTPAEATKRILELAPANSYDGTTPKGDSCSVMVQALDEDRVDVTVSSNSCPECADLRGRQLSFTVHPEIRGFDMGGSPATPIAKWTNKKDSVSFSVTNDDSIHGTIAIDVSIIALTGAKAALKVSAAGGEPIECTRLKAEPQWGGVH